LKENKFDVIGFLVDLITLKYEVDTILQELSKFCTKFNYEFPSGFELFDEDKDGFLNLKEFDKMLNILGFNLTMDEVFDGFQVFDVNNQLKISLDDFLNVQNGFKKGTISKKAAHLSL
jgi:Ca2+-binding EF-hand superfamily protein